MNQELLNFYKEYRDKNNAYSLALSMVYFDQSTIGPKNGAAYANKMTSILAGEAFSYATNPESIKKIEELSKEKDLDPELQKELEYVLEDLEEDRVLPKDLFVEYRQAIAEGDTHWHDAKEKNDYSLFKPYLKKVIEKQKEVLSYSTKKDMKPYDILLDKFQKGMNQEKYDLFFNEVKTNLIPLIQRIISEGKKIDDSILTGNFDVNEQEKFMAELNAYMQVNKDECYMGTTEHPFTSFFSSNDVRITTHYYPDQVMSAIFSTIHEYGHALYGLQIDERYEGTTLNNNVGFAMHESQSRFMENHIGKSRGFWEANYPKLQSHFAQFKDLSLDDFMDVINVSKPSLIRTEADELTYPLHIIIRYELEKEMFESDNIDFDHLDIKWAEKYEEYLGITPDCDAHGILQDMHWSNAYLGYFPTYALGSAYAAQFYHQLDKEMNVEEVLKKGEFNKISEWLKNNIHHYGAYKNADEILLAVTNEPFNPKYYIDYLTTKFKKVYNL